MDVAGVALATVISQVISAGLVFWCLVKSEALYGSGFGICGSAR